MQFVDICRCNTIYATCAGPGDVGEPGGAMVSVGVLIGAIIGIILLAAVINVATNITLLMYQKRR